MPSIRFGVATTRADSPTALPTLARRVEELGYDILLIPDHTFTLSPEVGLTTAAMATTSLRIGSLVFNNDLRHPVILAQQAATIDLLSAGRFELGLGAGWNEPEYSSMGLTMDRPSVRIARMEESARILKRLLSGETVSFDGEHYTIHEHAVTPAPPQGAALPLHVGGNGDKLLAAAARTANIVGISPYRIADSRLIPAHLHRDGIAERIEHVKRHAGQRWDDIEINVPVQHVDVTDERDAALDDLAAKMAERHADAAPTREQLAGSPYVLVGSAAQIAEQVWRHHDELGISFFNVWEPSVEALGPVVALVRSAGGTP